MEKDKSLIPNGAYCYNNGGNDKCPYWEFIEKKVFYDNPKINCEYHGICSDKEICGTTKRTSCTTTVIRCNYLEYTDYKGSSLLWDQVKECGINNE